MWQRRHARLQTDDYPCREADDGEGLAAMVGDLAIVQPDGARASLRGDQPTTAGGGYARLMGGQMPAALLSLIGMIAGVSIVASLLLIGLVYLMLSRAKRIFDAFFGF